MSAFLIADVGILCSYMRTLSLIGLMYRLVSVLYVGHVINLSNQLKLTMMIILTVICKKVCLSLCDQASVDFTEN